MRITVNGMERVVSAALTLQELLEMDEEPIGHALVTVNRVQVHLREYPSRVLEEGDEVDVILPAFGG